MNVRADDIAAWLRERVSAAGAQGLVVSLSGSVGSAVAARLCQIAAAGRLVAVFMPSRSDPGDETAATLVADRFKLPVLRINLDAAHDDLTSSLRISVAHVRSDPPAGTPESPAQLAVANVKPRLRMTALYFVAESLNCLVAGSANRAELTIGCCTKYGEAAVDLLPLGGLTDSEVRALARQLEVPDAIIDKAAGAGVSNLRTDQEEPGFTYAQLERYLDEGPDGVSPAVALRIERRIRMVSGMHSLPAIYGRSGKEEDIFSR